MERKSNNSMGYKIESQVRSDFGTIVYEYECHNLEAKKLTSRISILRIAEAVISAVTVACFIAFLITNVRTYSIIGTCSAIIIMMVLILNAYTNGYNLAEIREEHQHSSDLLYTLKEEYLTLITNLDLFDTQEVIKRREALQGRFYDICKNAPKISEKCKAAVVKKLNEKTEVKFSETAIDNMLPEWVRRTHMASEPSEKPAYIVRTDTADKADKTSSSNPSDKKSDKPCDKPSETKQTVPAEKTETSTANTAAYDKEKDADETAVSSSSDVPAYVNGAVSSKAPENVEASDIAD